MTFMTRDVWPARDYVPIDLVVPPAASAPLRWYAVYTSANHEKRVALQLGQRLVEHFLPVFESMRRWKDRRVMLELPLFPGYVFVKIALDNRLSVLRVPGVVRLVGFGGMPCALPDGEMETLRGGLTRGLGVQPHPYLKAGCRVRIKSGPFAGLKGILLRRKGNLRVVISLDLIQRSVSMEADASDLDTSIV